VNAVFLCGLLISIGLLGFVRSARPRTPSLDQLLETVEGSATATKPGFAGVLADKVDLASYREQRPKDLYLLGIDPGDHAQRKLLTAIGGATWLVFLPVALTALGVGLPPWWALIGGVFGAAFGFIYPDLDLRSSAIDARRDFDYAVAAFLGLARTLTTGGVEVNAALGAAASAGSGPWFEHLQRSCQQARVENREVAGPLGDLADRADVRALSQVSGSLQTATQAGTPPSQALATRTDMILQEQFHDMRMRAAERTEMMSVPSAAISLFFIVYVGLPAFVSLTAGTSPGL